MRDLVQTFISMQDLGQTLKRLGLCNSIEITRALMNSGPGKHTPTKKEFARTRALIKDGIKMGLVEKVGSGRWTQYQISTTTPHSSGV